MQDERTLGAVLDLAGTSAVVAPNPVSLLKTIKLGILGASHRLGLSSLVMNSGWRQQRLLILGYHGIALDDEHLWNPSLYMHPDMLRERMEVLRRERCAVLPLGEAVQRLYAGTLPKRSVAITFDDGFYDFYSLAHPILQEFGFPATLSLTTYYSNFNRPVFDTMCSYLLWKGRGRMLDWPDVLTAPVLLTPGRAAHVKKRLDAFSRGQGLSGREKDLLLATLAERLGINYEALCAKRILHLVTREEAGELARGGVDLQLHTHRHRVSLRRELFLREIDENGRIIAGISEKQPFHFCYPGGVHRPEFLPWLRERNVVLATTAEPGLASRKSQPLLLPRLVDTSIFKPSEFLAWVSGVASLLPRRFHVMSRGQFLEEGPGTAGPQLGVEAGCEAEIEK